MSLYEIRDLTRYYQRGTQVIRAVDGVDLIIASGSFVAIVGSSGSGKSTLVNQLARLDTPTSGEIRFNGLPFSGQSRNDAAAFRATQIGMVFQAYNLIPHRTAIENVELALQFTPLKRNQRRPAAEKMLTEVGLADRLHHRPGDLSGGEQQRVALARALVKQPRVLFADEPTGSLDEQNAEQIMRLFTELNHTGLTIVMVTHNLSLARQYASQIVQMHYGRIVAQSGRNERPQQ